jgi:MFS family permease
VPLYPIIRLITSVIVMTIGGAAMYASVMVLAPVAREFDVGRGAASLPYAAFMIGFGLGAIQMGRLADKVGVFIPTLLCVICMPVGLYSASYAANLYEFGFCLGFLAGFLGSAATFAPLVADISHWFTRRRGLAVGIVASGTYFAGALWPPILQHYFDLNGWRQTFRDLAGFSFVALLLLSVVLLPKIGHDANASSTLGPVPTPRSHLGMNGGYLQCLICLAGIGCCAAMAMPQVHIVPYAVELGFAPARGAEMLSLMLGFGIVSRIVSGWLSDRIGGLRTLMMGSGLQGLVLMAFLGADTLTLLYVTSIAFGLAQGGIVPSYAIIVRAFYPPGQAGWRIGAAILFTIAGMALGGWMAGILFDLTGSYTWSFINALAFNVLNLAIAVFLLKRASGRISALPAGAAA